MTDKTVVFQTTTEEQKMVRQIKRGELPIEKLDEVLKSAVDRAGRRIK